MIHYRNYPNFDKFLLLNDIEKVTSTNSNFPNQKLSIFNTNAFFTVVETHPSLKKELVSVNQTPFIVGGDFRNEIYTADYETNTGKSQYQIMNVFTNIKETNVFLFGNKTFYFSKVAVDGIVTSKSFWKFIKSFFKNKMSQIYNNVLLIQNSNIISEERDLAESAAYVISRCYKHNNASL